MRVLEVQMNCIFAIILVNKLEPIRLYLFEERERGEVGVEKRGIRAGCRIACVRKIR